jgi:hypothetical protein
VTYKKGRSERLAIRQACIDFHEAYEVWPTIREIAFLCYMSHTQVWAQLGVLEANAQMRFYYKFGRRVRRGIQWVRPLNPDEVDIARDFRRREARDIRNFKPKNDWDFVGPDDPDDDE